ncbi:hypothetical protein GCM10010254_23320 [Streptomyces chromofuscus]|nr:hypothetical protein GCM10010254_23320 [Streptomyces chromofuscus]
MLLVEGAGHAADAEGRLYAAIRRDHRGGMSMRELERTHSVTGGRVRKALALALPEPHKKLPPRPRGLDQCKPLIAKSAVRLEPDGAHRARAGP